MAYPRLGDFRNGLENRGLSPISYFRVPYFRGLSPISSLFPHPVMPVQTGIQQF